MTIPAWFWPASGSARGVALVPYAAGVAVADWSTAQIWPFSPAVSGFLPPISLASGVPGIGAALTDAAGNIWALTYTGGLYSLTTGGISNLIKTFPSGLTYVGLTSGGPSGFVYAVASSGQYYAHSGAFSGVFGSAAWFAASDTNYLYSLIPAASGLGRVPFSGGSSGVIALPAAVKTPTVLLHSGSTVTVGGWQPAPLLGAAVAAALNPAVPTFMLAVGSGAATIWTAPAPLADAWSLSGVLSGLANLNAVAWRPDGAQALATSLVSGLVQVITYATGTVTLTQTGIAISGACSVAVAGDSLHALIAQSGQAQATSLYYSGGGWITGTAVTGLSGIVAVAALGPSGICAVYSSGTSGALSILKRAGNLTWNVASTATLNFVPTCLTVDYFGRPFVAGSGSVAQFTSGGAVYAQGSWTGAVATAIAVQQGRVVVACPGDSLIRIFGLSQG